MNCLGMQRRIEERKSKPTDHPCGRCINCRINQQSEFVTKFIYEAKYSKNAFFTTNTFAPIYLDSMPPETWKRHMSLFVKRVKQDERRKHKNPKIRIIYNFEYGSKTYRPHWHMAIFNYHSNDREILLKHLLEQWEIGIIEVTPIKNPIGTGRYIAKHCIDLTEDKNDKLGYGVKPYRVSPNYLGGQYKKVYKNWHQSDIDRNKCPDPTGGNKFLRMPKEWKKEMYTETQIKIQNAKQVRKELERWNKLTEDQQHNEILDIYEKPKRAEKRNRILKSMHETNRKL